MAYEMFCMSVLDTYEIKNSPAAGLRIEKFEEFDARTGVG